MATCRPRMEENKTTRLIVSLKRPLVNGKVLSGPSSEENEPRPLWYQSGSVCDAGPIDNLHHLDAKYNP